MTRAIRGWFGFAWFCAFVPALTVALFIVLLVWLAVVMVVRPSARFRVTHAMGEFWSRCIFALMPGWRVRVENESIVRELGGRPVIVIANHQGNADIPAAYHLGFNFRWLAKESLFRVPILGVGARIAGYVPIRRGDRRSHAEAFRACREVLEAGDSIWFFPEGTRSPDGAIHAFKPGAFRLALMTGVPILPVVLRGTRELQPKGTLRMPGALVRVRVLPLMPVVPGEDEESFAARARELIMREFEAMAPG